MLFQRSKHIRTLGLLFACLALFGVAGGHWAALQSIAWARMLHEYVQETSVVEAVAKTFSGEDPCNLCERVKEGREKEEKSPATVMSDKKAEIFLSPVAQPLPQPVFALYLYFPVPDPDAALFMKAPPAPPPKSSIS